MSWIKVPEPKGTVHIITSVRFQLKGTEHSALGEPIFIEWHIRFTTFVWAII